MIDRSHKIDKSRWSAIGERFLNGETKAEIARSFQCSPQSIRYILDRMGLTAAREPLLPAEDAEASEAVPEALPRAARPASHVSPGLRRLVPQPPPGRVGTVAQATMLLRNALVNGIGVLARFEAGNCDWNEMNQALPPIQTAFARLDLAVSDARRKRGGAR